MERPWPYMTVNHGNVIDEGMFMNGHIHNGIRRRTCGCMMVGNFNDGYLSTGQVSYCDGLTYSGVFLPGCILVEGAYTNNKNNIIYIGTFSKGVCTGFKLEPCGKRTTGSFLVI